MKRPRKMSGGATFLVAGLVLIVIVLLYILFFPTKKAEAPIGNATITPAITADRNNSTSETDSYTIDADMPKVSGIASAAVLKSVNDKLAEKVNSIAADFKEQAVQIKPAGGPDTKSSLYVKMTSMKTVKEVVLAINIEISTYFSGAAHPHTVSQTSNFNLKTGADLQMIDIFDNSNVEYLKKISEYTTAELKKHLAEAQNVSVNSPDLQFFPEGADSNPENFSTFLIEDDGIRFLFGQYQVAPYVAGEQNVLVPYSEIKRYMQKGALTDALTK